jgi:hypothetical protein
LFSGASNAKTRFLLRIDVSGEQYELPSRARNDLRGHCAANLFFPEEMPDVIAEKARRLWLEE